MRRSGFTMIELVMVIVVLGILSSIAVSKMAVTRDDAILTKGRSDVASIRSAISLLRSKNMMSGKTPPNPKHLDALDTATSSDGKALFDYDSNSSDSSKKLLDYPIYSKDKNGHWRKTAVDQYAFKALNTDIYFKYSSGSFDCHNEGNNSSADQKKYCKTLTE
jgi:general secretion pathway protein G